MDAYGILISAALIGDAAHFGARRVEAAWRSWIGAQREHPTASSTCRAAGGRARGAAAKGPCGCITRVRKPQDWTRSCAPPPRLMIGGAPATTTACSSVRAGSSRPGRLRCCLPSRWPRASPPTQRASSACSPRHRSSTAHDLPWEIRARFGGDLTRIDLAASPPRCRPRPTPRRSADIPRFRQGRVGAQFWSVWIRQDQGSGGGADDARCRSTWSSLCACAIRPIWPWRTRRRTSSVCTSTPHRLAVSASGR